MYTQMPSFVGFCVYILSRPALRFATGLGLLRVNPETPNHPTQWKLNPNPYLPRRAD